MTRLAAETGPLQACAMMMHDAMEWRPNAAGALTRGALRARRGGPSAVCAGVWRFRAAATSLRALRGARVGRMWGPMGGDVRPGSPPFEIRVQGLNESLSAPL